MSVGSYCRRSVCLPGLLLAAAALAGTDAPAESGKALFTRYCSTCHGADAAGDTPLAKLLATPPPDLTGIAQRQGGWFPEDVVLATIDGRFVAHGTREMPVWGTLLDRGQLRLLTEHLYSIQRQAGD